MNLNDAVEGREYIIQAVASGCRAAALSPSRMADILSTGNWRKLFLSEIKGWRSLLFFTIG